ncbi:MAG TPA: diacylglycerol kinase family protein, partial [Limnochordales bacterium]
MRPDPLTEPDGPEPVWRSRRVLQSFRFAGRGLTFALRTQRNLRIHFFIALLVLVLAVALKVRRLELAVLVITIAGVLVAELFNTAVEVAVDLGSPHTSDLARIAKDVAAGAVLVMALAAVSVGLLVFYVPLTTWLTYGGPLPGRASPAHLTLAGACLVLLLTWGGKTLSTRPLRLSG